MRISVKLSEWEAISAGRQKYITMPVTTQWEVRLGQYFGAVYEDGRLLQGEDLPEFMRKDPEQEVDIYGGKRENAKHLRAVCRLHAKEHRFFVEIVRILEVLPGGKGRKE